MPKAIVTSNIPGITSQNVGKQAHNTVSNPHRLSHKIADEISAKHDRHSWSSDLGTQKINTASVGEDHGVEDGRDEGTPVEKA